jgi:uncharacterized protein YbcI
MARNRVPARPSAPLPNTSQTKHTGCVWAAEHLMSAEPSPIPAPGTSQAVPQPHASERRLDPVAEPAPDRDPTAPSTLDIANAMVHVYKEALGRGPTKARVLFAGTDTLVVVVEDTMTVQEHSLVAFGEERRLREHRLFLTSALEDQFRSIVEAALGRRTLAFVSGFDTHRDIAATIFTLEPEPTA